MKKVLSLCISGKWTILIKIYNMKKILLLNFSFLISFCVTTLVSAQEISAGANHSLSICIDSIVNAWGFNLGGQLGDGTTADKYLPVKVNFLSNVTAIEGGEFFSLALNKNDSVLSWGANSTGELGDGTTIGKTYPVHVSGLSNVVAIATKYDHSLALKNDSTVWAWGWNNYGQIGDGTVSLTGCQCKSSPVHVSGLTGVIAIACGRSHSLALKSDGTVWAWGYNNAGQLGVGSLFNKSIPTKVIGVSGIIAIAAGGYHSLALKSDGTLMVWGDGSWGEMGDGLTTDYSTPISLTGLAGITAIAAGELHSVALKNDSTLLAWGENYEGEVGIGTVDTAAGCNCQSIPVQVLGLTGITEIAANGHHTLAKKGDNTLWAWGLNSGGQLGDGTNIDKYSPVQVSGLCIIPAGINESETDNKINIYPNPFTSQTTIDLNTDYKKATLKVVDVLGKELNSINFSGRQVVIEREELKAGMYFIQIISENKLIATNKIIIN